MTIDTAPPPVARHHRRGVIAYSFFWSLALLAAVPLACLYTGQNAEGLFYEFYLILITPSRLVTDYFNVGGLGAAFLNAALCGLACNLAMVLTKPEENGTLLAGYFLVVAHCFYGLNLLNCWPPFFGVMLFCLLRKERIGKSLHLAMFSTSLAPFISSFLFDYTIGDAFVFGQARVTAGGIALALIFGLLSGFFVPALLPGTTKTHRGFNLFKAGLAIGLFGTLIYSFFYLTLGVKPLPPVVRDHPVSPPHGEPYMLFCDVFFLSMFVISFVAGFFENGRKFSGYGKIWKSDGWKDDVIQSAGICPTLVNIGIYGCFILAFLNCAILLTEGVAFTGATCGVTIAALTFSAAGQTPKNVWPIAAGYMLLFLLTQFLHAVGASRETWSLSTQASINGLAFATGLCPFTGRYGRHIGLLAGFLNAILCNATIVLHGGFVLYNGAPTAGLSALILLPALAFLRLPTKYRTPGRASRE